jgi:hypothetical protein
VTVYGHKGQIVHHNNCTYCAHRLNTPLTARKGHKAPIQERCALDQHVLPPPMSASRYCQFYQQNGCDCAACNPL